MGVVQRASRNFIPSSLKIEKWEDLSSFFEDLQSRNIDGFDQLKTWLKDLSELEAVIEEDGAWRYIRMTIDTTDEKASERYKTFVTEIQPHLATVGDALNKKLAQSKAVDQLSGDAYRIYLRGIKNDIALFKEENIALNTQLQELAQQYSALNGSMEIELNGETLTMQQAGAKLQDPDRTLREQVFRIMQSTRLEKHQEFDGLFNQMVSLRHEVAKNAGFDNFRDFKFSAMGRFDYSPQDCFNFHESIEKAIMPISRGIVQRRAERMELEKLRPWDLSVDPEGREPLKPFEGGEALIQKSIAAFANVDPFFGDVLQTMNDLAYLDLESKQGKAPGGYNYPLYESGVPFIFMNAVGTPRDLVTMMHEGGHAIHSVLTHDLELTSFKGCPSEVAELASMSMELISMDQWHLFYTDAEDLKRAKREQLEDTLSMLPWIAMVDAFQHWIYTNPSHTAEERKETWQEIEARFGFDQIDWSGLEEGKSYRWHRQLHIFEVPFYYIEYGMAQLGAIAVWRNYKKNPSKALGDFTAALKLGYTKSIGDIYETAGVRFDFSEAYISELADFVQEELSKLG
ncbi:MAG: M3 family oligoendopeptidase [Flavobacteriales bacterium]|nr:M3 family oligoendopeptidase [Flavobacteriales bacterium]MDG1781061.1 M3 family oligoendopeptidase [Flavobacteriales bacterium]